MTVLRRQGALFDVLDGSIPSDWSFEHYIDIERGIDDPILSFAEWVTDFEFQHKLADGDPEAQAIFKRHK